MYLLLGSSIRSPPLLRYLHRQRVIEAETLAEELEAKDEAEMQQGAVYRANLAGQSKVLFVRIVQMWPLILWFARLNFCYQRIAPG